MNTSSGAIKLWRHEDCLGFFWGGVCGCRVAMQYISMYIDTGVGIGISVSSILVGTEE